MTVLWFWHLRHSDMILKLQFDLVIMEFPLSAAVLIEIGTVHDY